MKQVIKHVPEQEKKQASQGIISPKEELLEIGSYIYRFANHTANYGYHAGSWWIRQEDFESIVARATRAKVDLGQKARWDLAVLQKWGSKMNVVVEARIRDRLWAWTGLAKPQRETTPHGRLIRMFGNPGIRQLYLIGVVDRSGILTPRARQCLSVTGAKVIPNSSIY